jgi:hypothetical protein
VDDDRSRTEPSAEPVVGAPSAAVPVAQHVDTSIADGDMLLAVAKGAGVGIPFVFGVLFLIDLVAGLDVPMAALGASIPGVIFGAFIGAAVFIGRASDKAAAPAS